MKLLGTIKMGRTSRRKIVKDERLFKGNLIPFVFSALKDERSPEQILFSSSRLSSILGRPFMIGK